MQCLDPCIWWSTLVVDSSEPGGFVTGEVVSRKNCVHTRKANNNRQIR
jgi:hypothetical protein